MIGDVYYNLIEMAIGAEINGKLIHQPASEPVLLPRSIDEPEKHEKPAKAVS